MKGWRTISVRRTFSSGAIFGRIVVAASLILPTMGMASFDEHDYLPEVVQHLERAKQALDMGQLSTAMAHTRVILHDAGLRVYIDTSAAPANQREDCQKSALKAIDFWNDTVDDPRALQLVDNPEIADVKVVFQSKVVLQGVEVGGYCLNTRAVTVRSKGDAKGEFTATIYARFTQPNGRAMNYGHLLNIVTHEFGHVFGLNDCTESGHLMAPLNLSRPRSELSAEESEAVRRLRGMAFDIQRNVLARKKDR